MTAHWIFRAALIIAALVATVVGVQLLRFVLWRRSVTASLSADSDLVHTARGPIEFVRVGDSAGVQVLWLHGNPGGYDQLSRTMAAEPEMRTALASIVVSRPGYLRTPLEAGRTPVEQAHLLAALLDSLRIGEVAVVGVSGGGPSALQFARLYPQRTRALVLAFAITTRIPPDPVGRRQMLADALGLGDWFTWRAAMRGDHLRGIDPSDTALVRSAHALLESTVPRSARRAGNANDEHQFDRPDGWSIDGIAAPTLLIAGTEDTTVPFAHVSHARSSIPGAQLVMIAGDHRASLTRGREVAAAIRDFVLAPVPTPAPR